MPKPQDEIEIADFSTPIMEALDYRELCELEGVYRRLSQIAGHLAVARAARLGGRIQEALDAEAEADAIYRLLPKWALW